MYLPSLLNLTSDIEEMISEKNDRFDGSSSSSNSRGNSAQSKRGSRVARTLCMPITQCLVSHISELDRPLGARVHKRITVDRVELGGSNDLSQLFHIDWLDVNNICKLIQKLGLILISSL